jgi:toxin ParE1/3/4
VASARLSEPATVDLEEAGRWIAADRPSAALRLRRAVAALARHIGEHPLTGMRRPELADDPLRFAVVSGFPYIIVYDSSRRPPLIVRMIHGARDLPTVLGDLRSEHGKPT